MSKKGVWLSLALTAVCMASCYDDNEAGGVHVKPPLKSCDPACTDGMYCYDGSCYYKDVTQDACTPACTDGMVCRNGSCILETDVDKACNPACDEDQTCEDGICVDPEIECDPICDDGFECVAGECRALGCGACLPEQQCVQGKCTPELCGEVVCGPDQRCYQDVCYANSEFCGEDVCLNGQKCFWDHCAEPDPCDEMTCPDGYSCIKDDSGLPGCISDLCLDNGRVKICGSGMKCVDGTCVESPDAPDTPCSGGDLDDSGFCTIPLKSLRIEAVGLAADGVDVRLDESVSLKVIYEPANTTQKGVIWNAKNVTEGGASNDVSKLVTMSDKSGETLKVTGISVYAGDIDLTVVSTADASIFSQTKLNVKPYYRLRPGDAYDDHDKHRKGDLKCNQYDDRHQAIFNRDLYEKFVQPKMIAKEKNGKMEYYPTRASVLAAARFLSMQFPYEFPYRMNTINSNTMRSHYVWSTPEKAKTGESVRIYGLNLTKNVYNDYTNSKVISSKATPWACKISSSSSVIAGLECSGYVTWSLRNGRFEGGDWKTAMFAGTNYKKTSWVNGSSSANPNNEYDDVVEKFKALDKDTDFIQVKNIKDSQIHAGDLLWHGSYTKSDGKTGSGHIAMVTGVYRKNDGSVKYVYVSEASAKGNRMIRYTFSGFKSSKWGETTKYKCYLIRMDKVYSYTSQKYGLTEDSNAYDDLW